MKHTKGPWHVEPAEWTHHRGIAICSAGRVLAIIDTGLPQNQWSEEDKANACLIAKAPLLPEMAGVLREWQLFIEELMQKYPDIEFPPTLRQHEGGGGDDIGGRTRTVLAKYDEEVSNGHQ